MDSYPSGARRRHASMADDENEAKLLKSVDHRVGAKVIHQPQIVMCCMLHLLLVILHFVLLIISINHAEHRVVIATGSTANVLAVLLSIGLQAFYTIYTAILLTLTQRLALVRDLSRPRLLTTIHDTSGAWNGIGSAILSLWKQTKVRASVPKVLVVVLYLLCIMVLHVSSSSLLQLQTFEGTMVGPIPFVLTWPDWTNMNGDYFEEAFNWEAISGLMPYVMRGNGTSQIGSGLANNTLYEVLSPNIGVGNATVRTETFQVECGLLSNSLLSIQVTNSTVTAFGELTANETVILESMLSGPNQVVSLPVQNVFPMNDTANTVYFLTNASPDIDESLLPQVKMTVDMPSLNSTIHTYLIACGAHLVPGNATVNAASGQVLELIPSSQQTTNTETWKILDWSTNTSFGFNSTYFNGMVAPFHESSFTTSSSCWDYELTLSDIALMGWIGCEPTCGEGNYTYVLGAGEMQNGVGHLLASSYFTAGLLDLYMGFQPPPGSLNATLQVIQLRLNINILPLSFMMTASIGLCLLCLRLIHIPRALCLHPHSDQNDSIPIVQNIGVLDVLWLSARFPALHERLAGVVTPDEESLRAAGRFRVCFAVNTVEGTSGEEVDIGDDIGENGDMNVNTDTNIADGGTSNSGRP